MKHYASFFGFLFLLIGVSPCCATGDTVADLAKGLKSLNLTSATKIRVNRVFRTFFKDVPNTTDLLGHILNKTSEMPNDSVVKINGCSGAPCKEWYKVMFKMQKERRKALREGVHPYLKSFQKKINLKPAEKSGDSDNDIIGLGAEILNFLKSDS